MAEDVTPTTSGPGHLEHDARQAVQAWEELKAQWYDESLTETVIERGDALAVLVPQLLADLDEERTLHDLTRDGLARQIRQLLDQLTQADAANAEAQKTLTMVRQQRDECERQFQERVEEENR